MQSSTQPRIPFVSLPLQDKSQNSLPSGSHVSQCDCRPVIAPGMVSPSPNGHWQLSREIFQSQKSKGKKQALSSQNSSSGSSSSDDEAWVILESQKVKTLKGKQKRAMRSESGE